MSAEDLVFTFTASPMKRIFNTDMGGEDFTYISGMRNEPLSFSLAYRSLGKKGENGRAPDTPISLRVRAEIPVSVYKTCKVSYAAAECEDAKKDTAGGCPDILQPRNPAPEIIHMPLDSGTRLPYYEKDEPNTLNASCFATQSALIAINEEGKTLPAGDYTVTVEVIGLMSGKVLKEHSVTVHLIDASLPENDLMYTNWFHYDCLSDITHTPVWSDAFFALLEKYLRNSVKNGMNTLLFPTFTPPLDTVIGGERMNVQLVKIKKNGDDYAFDFSLAERFVSVARRAGIKTFEHTHLFSQWGAEHAINIYAEVDGKEKRIFDYTVDASDKEYVRFLEAYLHALAKFAKKAGIENDILYHISDEPVMQTIEGYRRAKALMRSIFPNGKFADALDDYAFYKEGLVEIPIVDVESIENYDGRCDSLMLYYTGGEVRPGIANRILTSAPQKTRALGLHLFRYKAKGFLHWAYNYYYGRMSSGCFHPAFDPCFYKNIPGVTYLVYPDTDGSPLPSLREKQMLAAMNDYRALRLLESLSSYEETLSLCEKFLGTKISVTTIPESGEIALALREAINARIEERISK